MIDLRLAAEIGKSLLENNLALKSNYQDLLINTPFPTPTNSSSLLNKQAEKDKIAIICQYTEEEESEEQSEKSDINEYEYVPLNRTREALVEILEKENADLSFQLEQTLLNQEKLERTNSKKARQLKAEVEFLQTNLDHATLKIQELEENRKKKTLTFKAGGDHAKHTNSSTVGEQQEEKDQEDQLETNQQIWIDEKIATLNQQLEQLRAENHHVLQSKSEIEKKLHATLKDLHTLKQEYDQFQQFTLEDHEKLKKSFEVQHLHVQELNHSLEEYRHTLAKLKERGIYISPTTSPFLCYSSNNYDDSLSDDDSYFRRKIREDSIKRDNLLTELENAWFKRQSSSPPRQQKKASFFQQPFQAIYNQLPNVDSALESIILKAGVVEKDALDDALSLIGRLEHEYDHEKFLQEKRHIYYDTPDYNYLEKRIDGGDDYYYYNDDVMVQEEEEDDDDYYYYLQEQQLQVEREVQPKGLVEYAKYTINSMIFMAWQWFRFMLIMIIAIFISLKEGPDALSS